jgi:hypothetical protein
LKIFYDTEFIEDGSTIGLISIGMVAEDGRELYRIVDDEDIIIEAVEHTWLRANVIPSLPILLKPDAPSWEWDFDSDHADWPNVQQRPQVVEDVRAFILATPQVELWADYAAYDHVALAQLFGPMVKLPDGIPMWTNDLRQEMARRGAVDADLPVQDAATAHNSLADARWLQSAHDALYPF